MLRKKQTFFLIFLLVLIVFCVILYRQAKTVEPFVDNPQYVVCLMCVCPNEVVINFAKDMSKIYKTYIVCDNVNCNTPTDTDITFIKISDQECNNTGWTKSNVAIDKIPSAWDKALYYFAVKETNPSYVWFIEEDVFIPRYQLISELDKKYPTADLVAKQNVSRDEDPEFGWWFDAENAFEKPLYRSLVCASRVSRALLNKVVDLVKQNGRLVFIEVMFNTIVYRDKMDLVMPEELYTIEWRREWITEHMDDKHMYHPIKDMNIQGDYRERLTQVPARKN